MDIFCLPVLTFAGREVPEEVIICLRIGPVHTTNNLLTLGCIGNTKSERGKGPN